MLQKFIIKGRKKIFENVEFYYWLLFVLITYFLFNRLLQKLSYVVLGNRWVDLRIGESVLFGLTYIIVLISCWFLRKRIPFFIFLCWGGLIFIFFINELSFAWTVPNYDIIQSISKGQAYYTAKLTMPLLFWGVWSELDKRSLYGVKLINYLKFILLVNSILIIIGVCFNVSVFESYPLSGRWGYSGILWHLSFHSFIYGIYLMYLLKQKKRRWDLIILFSLALFFLGQKAGLLYLFLIYCLIFITNNYLRLCMITTFVIGAFSSHFWVPYVISFSTFWQSVYNQHGVWGVLLSLRNKNITEAGNEISSDFNIYDILFGGVIRYPISLEMMPLDIFIYFGLIGVFLLILFYLKIIKEFGWSIPLVVACVAGGIYEAPMAIMIYFVFLKLNENVKA